jgi:TonB family protein
VLAEISFKGRALVEALVDFDGSVIAARLVLSSGFAQADTEACRAALGSRFSPAENREVPCRVWVRLPYEWDYEVKERLKSSKPSQEYDPSRNQY